ncbi:MAG TPA: Hsp20/alpha crystallin family protein [Conexivisphaerales archaeon]|nr:Hsp20/alpha crystallin family protein [Conexivisphaerales archaeon]
MTNSEGKKVPEEKEETKSGTSLTPWSPEEYVHYMARVFDDAARRFERDAPFGDLWLEPKSKWFARLPGVRRPYADLVDTGKEYRLVIEVPGIPKDKLDITVTDSEITVEGEAKTEVKQEKEGFVRRERGYSKMSRTMLFPEPVESEKAEASVKDGVLEVTVPKKTPTQVKGRKLSVK